MGTAEEERRRGQRHKTKRKLQRGGSERWGNSVKIGLCRSEGMWEIQSRGEPKGVEKRKSEHVRPLLQGIRSGNKKNVLELPKGGGRLSWSNAKKSGKRSSKQVREGSDKRRREKSGGPGEPDRQNS